MKQTTMKQLIYLTRTASLWNFDQGEPKVLVPVSTFFRDFYTPDVSRTQEFPRQRTQTKEFPGRRTNIPRTTEFNNVSYHARTIFRFYN